MMISEASHKTRIYLVLVCGPPAIGKTKLTDDFHRHVTTIAEHESRPRRSMCSFKIHYDDVIDTRLESQLVENNEWKKARETIQQLVCSLIDSLLEPTTVSSTNTRQKLSQIGEHATSSDRMVVENFTRVLESDLASLDRHRDCREFLILLDDVFYYESMRYALYRALFIRCRECCSSYFSVCLHTSDLDMLTRRNHSRAADRRVSDESIEKIFRRFEQPKEWELPHSHSIEINTSNVLFDLDSLLTRIVDNHETFCAIVSKFRDSMMQTSSDTFVDTNRNLAHESDLILRRLVKEKLSGLQDSNDIGALAKLLAVRKAALFADLKNSDSELFKILTSLNDLNLIETELRCRLYE